MKTTKQLLSILLLIITFSTYGQLKTETNEEQLPYIEVTGTAEKEVIPDEIFIGFYLSDKYENKTKVSIEQQEVKLKLAIQSIGVDIKNLAISNFNADYIRVTWQKKDVLTTKFYTLKVADASVAGKFFQKLDSLEIKDAFISKVNYSKMDSLRKEVKIMAIKAAKDKADYLLAAINEKTGKPIIVKEVEPLSVNSSYYTNVNISGSRDEGTISYVNGISMKDKAGIQEIQFQKIKVFSSMYVKFLIK